MMTCPFDRLECRRYYRAGQMDMLFNLADAGEVPLDVAASFAGMSVEDAADMLQGWIEAQQIPDGSYGGEQAPGGPGCLLWYMAVSRL